MLPSQPAPGSFHLSWSQLLTLLQPFPSAAPAPHQTPICPLVKADTATTAPGGIPAAPELALQRTSFSEHALSTLHEVVKCFMALVTP